MKVFICLYFWIDVYRFLIFTLICHTGADKIETERYVQLSDHPADVCVSCLVTKARGLLIDISRK